MLVYKCDGESFTTGKKCASEVKDELPKWWLSITGKIKNGLHDAHYIECNGTRHFCSRRCLENFLFKDVNPPADSPALHTMTTDPKEQEVKEQEGAGAAADAEAQNEQAQDSEEGTTEG